MASSYRPRRTRIYGANYDIGESYYKKQLDSLDNKRGVSRLGTPSFASSYIADDYKAPEPSYKTEFPEDNLLSYPAMKSLTAYEPLSDAFDDDLPSTRLTKRISAVRFGSDDLDLGHLKLRDTKKHFDAFDVDKEASEGYVSRRLKMKTGIIREERDASTEEASMRVKATRSRLADLESEMFDLNQKQSEREKRSLNLKRLLNDCDAMKEIEY